MKTNDFFSKKSTIYAVFGIFGLILTSCSSYQNKSYYDNDGIYGASTSKPRQTAENTKASEYKEYFSSLNNQTQQEIFTDVNSYSSYNDTVSAKTTAVASPEYSQNNYSGWGNNGSDQITVNVYGNNWNGWNNFGWGGGWNNWYGNNWGWNNWYGNNWGYNGWYGNNWGYGGWYGNNWGYGGWYGNNWGYSPWAGNGYYGNGYYNNGYTYGVGRRNSGGIYANENGSGYYNSGRSATGNRDSNLVGGKRFENNTRSNTNSLAPRNYDSNSNIRGNRTNANTRNYDSNTRGFINNSRTREAAPSRNNSESTRSNSEPTRSYSEPIRSYSEPSRSNSGGGSFGGGGGGGGRSSGGGRR